MLKWRKSGIVSIILTNKCFSFFSFTLEAHFVLWQGLNSDRNITILANIVI